MLAYYCVYKNVRRVGSEQTQAAHKAYTDFKKVYRTNLNKAKKSAYENYIQNSNNKCKAAWEIIAHENTSINKNEIPVNLDSETINNYFINSVQELGKQNSHHTVGEARELMNKTLEQKHVFYWREVQTLF